MTRSILRSLLFLLQVAFPTFALAGELTQLVTDLNPAQRQDDPYASIGEMMDGKLYFTKESLSYGTELWSSDGTSEGTRLTKDFVYGEGGGSPGGFTRMNGSLFFWAMSHRNQVYFDLWKSDGTEEGTVMLPATEGTPLVRMGNKLYYLKGNGLSQTDGTPEGTGPLSPTAQFSFGGGLTAIGGTLFFNAYNDSQVGLWKSDGTAAGTVLVKELTQLHNASSFAFTEANGKIYFVVSYRDGSNIPRRQLWKTDGTEAGTVRIDPLGLNSQEVRYVAAANGSLFFTTSANELWKTDGTQAGTVLVKSLEYNPIGAMRVAGGKLCIQTTVANHLFSLWGSDGTEEGTVKIGSFTSGYDHAVTSPPLMPHEGKLYFQASGEAGAGLYVTDGTAAGTRLVFPAEFGSSGYTYTQEHYRSTEAGLFFQAITRKTENGETIEDSGIYVTDGTGMGTRLFVDLDSGTESSNVEAMIPSGDHLYFIGGREYDSSSKLWRTDGSAAGTVELPLEIEWHAGAPLREAIASRNGNLYFRGSLWNEDGSKDHGIMKHDDETGVTTRVLSLPAPDPSYYYASYFAFLGSRTAFIVDKVVYVYDESTGVTKQLLQTEGASSLISGGGYLYFTARTAGSNWCVWRSDGTPSGTHLIPQTSTYGYYSQLPIAVSETRGQIYYTEGAPYYHSLYRNDGTPGGTVSLKTFDRIGKLHEAGGKMFFIGSTGEAGNELWVTDGTTAGTRMVKDITVGYNGTFSSDDPGDNMAVLNGRVYFSGPTPSYGKGLWTSDGTEAGTYLFKDIGPGITKYVSGITLFRGKLLFAADDGIHGEELWESDGTEAGTRMLADASGNSAPSNPMLLTPHGTDLYFTAYTEEYGRELFIYSEGTAAPPVVEQPTVSSVGRKSATLDAVVTPNRSVTTAVVEYGTTPALGSTQSIPLMPQDGRGQQPHVVRLRNLQPETTYYFRLSATNDSGADHSQQGTFTTLEKLLVLEPPAGLTATLSGDNEVRLSWQAGPEETSYRIERRNYPAGAWNSIGTSSLPTYLETTLVYPNHYEYRVIAINDELTSAPSAAVELRFGPPETVVATATAESPTSVRISWQPVAGATSYTVYCDHQAVHVPFSGWQLRPPLTGNQTSILHDYAKPGSTYYYFVYASNQFGQSGSPAPASATTPLVPPPAPTLRLAREAEADVVALSWNYISELAHGFRLERRILGETEWTVVMNEPHQPYATATVDETVTHLTTYEYRLIAFNASGESPPSAIVEVTIPDLPSPPWGVGFESLEARILPVSQVQLLWSDSRFETGYRIERSTDGSDWQTIGETGANQQSWTDETATAGVHYWYRLTAFNPKGITEMGRLKIEAADTPVIFADDFEPDLDETMWTSLSGAQVIEEAGTGNHVLRVDGLEGQGIVTREVDLTLGARVSFRFRGTAGEQPPIIVEIQLDGQLYGGWLELNPESAGFNEWNSYSLDLQPRIIPTKGTIRIGTTGKASGSPWEIDDLVITGVVPRSLPGPIQELTCDYSDSLWVQLKWEEPYGASNYIVERRTMDTDWTVVGYGEREIYIYEGAAFFDRVSASTEYFYRVTAVNPGGVSAPSPELRVVSMSAAEDWRRTNYGEAHDTPAAAPLADGGTGIPNLLRFAFNMTASEDIWQSEENRAYSGIPVIARNADSGLLRVEFFRRKEEDNPEIDYIVEFSDDCKTWEPGGRLVEVIPSPYDVEVPTEKVIWQDDPPASPTAPATRFARVRVTER